MIGSAVMGFVCDKAPAKSRRGRAFIALVAMIIGSLVIWGCGLAYQLTVGRLLFRVVQDLMVRITVHSRHA